MAGPPRPPPAGRQPPPPPGSRERRQHPRYAIEARVTVSHALSTWTGQLVNISTGGVLVEIAELGATPEVGDDCSVFIRLDDAQLLIAATLVRVSAGRPVRMALQWASRDVAVIKNLANLLEKMNPELVP